MLHDIRFAFRGFRRSPGFPLTVIVTIGLALGLNTTMFTIFNTYVLRPFEVRDPYGLYNLSWTTKSGRQLLNLDEFEQLKAQAGVLDAALATENIVAAVEGQPLIGQRVTPDYFSTLGVHAAMGRPLEPGDTQHLVLSYGAWTAKYAADPQILGRSFPVSGKVYTVIGVAKRGFEGVAAAAVDFWIPIENTHPAQLQLVVRLKPGVSVRETRAQLDVLAPRITEDRPESQRATGVLLASNATPLSFAKATNYVLFAPTFVAFGLVLLIACANVANMLLARAAGRQKEMSVRLALGAGRGRIIRQLLVESMLLALPSALIGLAIALIATRTALQLYFATVPKFLGGLARILPLDADFRVFGFLLAAAFTATLVFGLAPALQAARSDIAGTARGESGGYRPSRLRNTLVVSQIAVCSLLLIVAGVLLSGSAALEKYDAGVATHNIIDTELQKAFPPHALESLRREPWLNAATLVAHAPLTSYRTIAIGPLNAATMRSGYNFVSPDYFDLLKIAIVRGRTFSPDEANGEAPVAMVSENTARLFWPGRDPVGEVIRIEPQPQVDRGEIPAFRRAQVVGVVRDITTSDVFDGRDPSMFYFPASTRSATGRSLIVRVKEDNQMTRRALNDTLERIAPGAARLTFSLDEILAVQIFPFRISLAITGFLGALALLLAISGIYGVLSYLVAQRTREIGIRMALGASAGSVVRLVLAQSSRFSIWGIAIGTGLALGVSRIFASILENMNTDQPAAYVAAIAAVFLAGTGAALVPSRRAARVDPASTLRQD